MNKYCFFPSSIGAVLDHIADILSSPGLSTAQDLQTLPDDYKDFDKNFKKFVSNAQNVDSKYLLVEFLSHEYPELLRILEEMKEGNILH